MINVFSTVVMTSQVSDYVQMQQHVYTEHMQILLLTMLQLKEKRKKNVAGPYLRIFDSVPLGWSSR